MSDEEIVCLDDADGLFSDNLDPDVLIVGESRDENATAVTPPGKRHLEVLHKRFGHRNFRPIQWQIIRSIIIDRRDVCAIMSTGYGKSLCYQFPPVFTHGLTIVVSPLISLMEDQVLALEMYNIPACLLGSAQSDKYRIIDEILQGNYSIVYATPEFSVGSYGKDILKRIQEKRRIDLLAIDEAHCVSQWGHDFRPQYRHLFELRDILQDVPILAVTATATPTVQDNIIKALRLNNPLIVCSGFDRPNLFFEVRKKTCEGPYPDMKPYITSGSTIIYCLTKKTTENIAKILKLSGINCAVYHAGLPLKQRKETHEQFVKDKIKVVVATVAFGMGIDKQDVRTVIHYGAAKDIEGYYQEVGRAGRDGLSAKCVVFYSAADFSIHDFLRQGTGASATFKLRQEEGSRTMQKYLDFSGCRRRFILEHFGDKTSEKLQSKRTCCDNCIRMMNAPKVANKYQGVDDAGLYDYTEDARLFLQAVNALGGRYGIQMYVYFLRGSKNTKIKPIYQSYRLYGSGKHQPDDWWKIIARILNQEGFLGKTFQKKSEKIAYNYSTVNVSPKGHTFLKNIAKNKKIELKIIPPPDLKKLLKIMPSNSKNEESSSVWIEKPSQVVQDKPSSSSSSQAVSAEDTAEKDSRIALYRELLSLRNDIAHNMNHVPYLVASNTALMQMTRLRPTTLAKLEACEVEGFNEGKVQRFGQQFVDAIKNFVRKKNLPCTSVSSIKTAPDFSSGPKNPALVEGSWISKKTAVSSSAGSISDLKKFEFSERKLQPKCQTTKVEEEISSCRIENLEVDDEALNEIFDAWEEQGEETFTNLKICSGSQEDLCTKSQERLSAKEPTESQDTVQEKTNEEDSLAWLDSPETCDFFTEKEEENTISQETLNLLSKKEEENGKTTSDIPDLLVEKQENTVDLFESDSFDCDLMKAVAKAEKTLEKNIGKGTKKRLKDTSDNWCSRKKNRGVEKYLEF